MRHLVLLALCAGALAAPVGERWGNGRCTHPGTLRVERQGSVVRLVFDLSAIPAGARVHRASLRCFTQEGRQPLEDPQLFEAKADGSADRSRPLRLEPPWYRSFDATGAVGRAVGREPRKLTIVVARFDAFLPQRTCLDVVYEGRPRDLPRQVEGVRMVHHHGQTFIVWREAEEFRPRPDEVVWVEKFSELGDKLAAGPGQGAYGMPNHPAITLRTLRRLQGLGLRDKPSGFQGIKPLRRVREVAPITYRVYRHTEPITPANIHEATLLAEVPPLSGFDTEVYKIHFKGEYLDQWEDPASVIPTLCVARGKPLAPGEALYVHTPRRAAKAYYAVTVVRAGTENLAEIRPANAPAAPVEEKPGTPQPVLQWRQEDRYKKDVDEFWYRYWAAPPYCNLPSRSFRVAVAVGQKFKEPGPLVIGTISGAFNVRGALRVPRSDAVTILIKRQLDWLPALFYNEGRGTLRGMTACKVDYFPERYMEFLIKWIMSRHRIDHSRIVGSLLHFGIRHPEIFTRMSFGTYTAAYDVRWAPGGPAMPTVLGPKGIKTTRGEDAWKMYSIAEYLKAHPDRDIPFLLCISSTGKDRGHTSEFGWQDDPRGWRGLLDARQPFAAFWSCHPPSELTAAFNRTRWDTTLPAFSNCSLDNNPGNGDPTDGDYYGAINGWLVWEDAREAANRWEATLELISSCPESRCTVDVTPRHCRLFKPRRGQTFRWTNTDLATRKVIQSGRVEADEWGLVTIRGVVVTKSGNRLAITPM